MPGAHFITERFQQGADEALLLADTVGSFRVKPSLNAVNKSMQKLPSDEAEVVPKHEDVERAAIVIQSAARGQAHRSGMAPAGVHELSNAMLDTAVLQADDAQHSVIFQQHLDSRLKASRGAIAKEVGVIADLDDWVATEAKKLGTGAWHMGVVRKVAGSLASNADGANLALITAGAGPGRNKFEDALRDALGSAPYLQKAVADIEETRAALMEKLEKLRSLKQGAADELAQWAQDKEDIQQKKDNTLKQWVALKLRRDVAFGQLQVRSQRVTADIHARTRAARRQLRKETTSDLRAVQRANKELEKKKLKLRGEIWLLEQDPAQRQHRVDDIQRRLELAEAKLAAHAAEEAARKASFRGKKRLKTSKAEMMAMRDQQLHSLREARSAHQAFQTASHAQAQFYLDKLTDAKAKAAAMKRFIEKQEMKHKKVEGEIRKVKVIMVREEKKRVKCIAAAKAALQVEISDREKELEVIKMMLGGEDRVAYEDEDLAAFAQTSRNLMLLGSSTVNLPLPDFSADFAADVAAEEEQESRNHDEDELRQRRKLRRW